MTSLRADPGSFRDSAGRIFHHGGEVFRGLDEAGAADFEALEQTEFFRASTRSGLLAATEATADVRAPSPWDVATLRHERIPFISYPYEWPFTMLQDAALLQLKLLRAALQEGLTMKDASAYNVQWSGARPVFIDIGSFEKLREGEPWVGYRQFCMQHLYPLMLETYKGVSGRALLRGSIEGIAPEDMRRLMAARDLLRRGVPAHVVLHARLARTSARTDRNAADDLRRAGFRAELIDANAARLEKLVRKLSPKRRASEWQGYGEQGPYSDSERARKIAVVTEVAASRHWGLVWDLGAHDGTHARLMSEHADYVVAVDHDDVAVDDLFRTLRNDGPGNVLPLVMDLVDPSPALGWRGTERLTMGARGRPELVLCLAVIHHMALSRAVPLDEIVTWLGELGGSVVVEFPDRADPMVQILLARTGAHPEYSRETFERLLAKRFDVQRTEPVSDTRTLYVGDPR